MSVQTHIRCFSDIGLGDVSLPNSASPNQRQCGSFLQTMNVVAAAERAAERVRSAAG